MSFQQKTPAVWTQLNHFSVSEKGAIKPSGDAYEGSPCFLTLEAAEHILNNVDSFRKAIEESKKRTMLNEVSKELTKLRVTFMKNGLTPEQAEQAVQAIIKNKQAAS
jgi:hypothetical protein